MTRAPIYTRQFEKDIRRVRKRGKNLEKLKPVLALVIDGQSLPTNYRDHPLRGNYVGRRECHIEPDWLLIYTLRTDAVIFERTGSHADLFE
jgi:mRNA interferase YafQ